MGPGVGAVLVLDRAVRFAVMRIRRTDPRASGPLRAPAVLTAGLLASGLLAGCSGDGSSEEAADTASASTSSSAAETSGSDEGSDLASGLLPAEAFGADATVVAITPEQLAQGTGLAGSMEGVQITPEACASAVQGTQPAVEDFEDVAAQSATRGTAVTAQVLMRGGPTDGAVDVLTNSVAACPQAQVTSPDIGQATITFEALPVPELGDASAAVRLTTTIAQPDGTQVSVPTLIGLVEDGDRLMTLVSLDQGGAAPDPAAFTALLQEGYEVQADALG